MKPLCRFLLPALLVAVVTTPSYGTLIESWQFNDASETQLDDLVNDGTEGSSFTGNKDQAVTDGVGALKFTVGLDGSDNVFRNSTLNSPNQSSGTFELEFSILTADWNGGDSSGANVGFGVRDEGGTDLFLIRLQETGGGVKLQSKVGGSTDTINNFGGDALTGTDTPLIVRAVFNLDTDLLDVFYTAGAAPEDSSLGIAIPDLEFDQVRLVANTNSTDWGAADSVTVDYLTITTVAVPEPTALLMLSFASLAVLGTRRRVR